MKQRTYASRQGCVIIFSTLAIVLVGTAAAKAAGDATHGEVLYHDCQNCHSIDKNDVGPMHKGVVGRISGTVPGYDYSPALRDAKIVWTEENLDKWLADPENSFRAQRCFSMSKTRRIELT